MTPEAQSNFAVRVMRISVFAAILLACALAALVLWQRSKTAQSQARSPMRVTSASFSDGGTIPSQHTCDGDDTSPALQWSDPPAATKSFAIVMNDPDAPVDFTHWIAYNIPPDVWALAEGASAPNAMPKGSAEGTNGFGRFGYAGPCPPLGEPHHYIFSVYALDIRLELPPGVTRKQFDAAISGHVLARGRIIGSFQHSSQ